MSPAEIRARVREATEKLGALFGEAPDLSRYMVVVSARWFTVALDAFPQDDPKQPRVGVLAGASDDAFYVVDRPALEPRAIEHVGSFVTSDCDSGWSISEAMRAQYGMYMPRSMTLDEAREAIDEIERRTP